MAGMWSVSISLKNKDLIDWINERIGKNEISPSNVFREAMEERKKEWDIQQSTTPEQKDAKIKSLEKGREALKSHLENTQEFITHKNLNDEFYDFIEEQKSETKKIEGSKVIIRETEREINSGG